MLHPPKFYQHDYYYQTGGYSGPAVDEKAPVFGDKVTKGYVHFDLDPTNGMCQWCPALREHRCANSRCCCCSSRRGFH